MRPIWSFPESARAGACGLGANPQCVAVCLAQARENSDARAICSGVGVTPV